MRRAAIAVVILGGAAVFWWRISGSAQAKSMPEYIDAGIGAINEGVEMIKEILFRGERNNNPGNIRISSANWQGKTAGKDVAFETFTNPSDGIRAMAKLLKNYQSKYGLNTVRSIIGRWAPSSENNTDSYVNAVSRDMGVGADSVLDLNDDETLRKLVTAVIRHENGRVIYSANTISQAVASA